MRTALDAWVYRDGRRRRNGRAVVEELARLVRAVEGPRGSRARISSATDALVACGELEAALADLGHPSGPRVAEESEWLATAALGAPLDSASHAARLEQT